MDAIVTPPNDPADYDEYIRRVARSAVSGVEPQPSNFANWGLGLFGAAIIVMLGFVLNAVYTTNGDLHEVKGQNTTLQAEVTAMQLQLANLSERVAITDAGKRP